MSAAVFSDDVQKCLDGGMDDHVAKLIGVREVERLSFDWKKGIRITFRLVRI